jgi:hypothetical protein
VTILRRALISLLAAAAVLTVVPVPVLGTAQEVIEDYRDDGQIQGCYSTEDFNQAVRELDPNEGIYEVARDVIRQAQARCAAAGETSSDDGGSGAGVWIGIVIAVGLVALGAGALARRRGGNREGGGSGTDGG